MNGSVVQRPIGFRPEEISAMVNEVVVQQHAEEAAFLWTQRDRAVSAPNFRLKDLSRLDERVEAHLDGLRVAGQYSWQLCEKALEEPEPGEVFASAVLAFGGGDPQRIKDVLETASPVPNSQRGLVSALGWLPFNEIETVVQGLAVAPLVAQRRIAIAACAAHRRDLGQPLSDALSDADPQLRARALKACGELGKRPMLSKILPSLSDSDKSCRFFAAWSAARIGNRSPEVLRVLHEIALKKSRYSEQALEMALRTMELQEAKAWHRQLRMDRARWRLAAIAIGIIGDPGLVSDLLELMKTPDVARSAGAAFALLTGVDLPYEDLDGEPPADFGAGPNENPEDENVQMDPDGNLPWPVPSRVAEWWKKNGSKFSSGKRYFLGQEMNEISLRKALVKAYQPQRAAAALEMSLRQPSQPLFEVRARGGLQAKLLEQWKS
jgi:uncharacterized protein (TIGR02270 family)